MVGDAYANHRARYEDKTKSAIVATTDDTTSLAAFLTAKSANFTLYIQRIRFYPTTYSQKNFTYQDTNSSAKKIGRMHFPAAGPETGNMSGQHDLDYGAEGIALTAGKNLDIVVSAAGVGGLIIIEAYQRNTSGALNTGNAA